MTDAIDTVIRISARPGWHQRTRLGLHSPELLRRMEEQAWLALVQFRVAAVEVIAIRGRRWRGLILEKPVPAVRTGVRMSGLPVWVRNAGVPPDGSYP